jgi:SpoIIAA-like
MLKFELLRDTGVLVVEPRGALAAEDFQAISQTVDPFIRENGKLTGLLIDASSFPGWQNFGALIGHIRFVRNHHRNIDRVAAVTDSTILAILPKIAEHFAHPEFKVFRSGERASALAWLQSA